MSQSRLINRNVTASRGRTSMRMEPELWDALEEICLREGLSLGEIVRRIEGSHDPGGRTSAVRVYVLRYFREAATDEGHRSVGHGAFGGHPLDEAAKMAKTIAEMVEGTQPANQTTPA